MSPIEHSTPRVLPPLVAGQRLDQPTFHERYGAMPQGTWAELIGGMVFMPSPLFNDHVEVDENISYWLNHYKRFTRGVRTSGNATTILGNSAEVQPDCQLRIPEELGGQTRIVGGYIVGAPELVVEVGGSSRKKDLGPKKADYEGAGVLEYLFAGIEPGAICWFVRHEGRFVDLQAGPDGFYRSEVFPGLWLDPIALSDGDMEGMIAVLEQGLATPEHAAFVERLAIAKTGR